MFYFLHFIIVLYNILIYALFRGGITEYMRRLRISKSYIKKNKKGFLNYWFYRDINKDRPIGAVYYLNIIYLSLTAVYSLLAIVFGYMTALKPLLLILSIIICVLQIPAGIFDSVQNCMIEYNKPFVLIAKKKGHTYYYSSLFDMLSWCITAVFIYASYVRL